VTSFHDRPGTVSSRRLTNPQSLALLSGLAAGLLGFALGEITYDAFPAQRVPHNIQGSVVLLPSAETQLLAMTKSSALAFGEFGAMLGLCLGWAGGLARRPARGAWSTALLGMLAGGLAGALLPTGVIPIFMALFRQFETRKLELALLMHGLVWGVLGAIAGLAFAKGRGERLTTGKLVLGGLAGAILATVAADLIGALFFPMDGTDEAISSSWTTRLIARLLVGLGVGAGIALALRSSRSVREGPVASKTEPASPLP
jgi:hypothetical protein